MVRLGVVRGRAPRAEVSSRARRLRNGPGSMSKQHVRPGTTRFRSGVGMLLASWGRRCRRVPPGRAAPPSRAVASVVGVEHHATDPRPRDARACRKTGRSRAGPRRDPSLPTPSSSQYASRRVRAGRAGLQRHPEVAAPRGTWHEAEPMMSGSRMPASWSAAAMTGATLRYHASHQGAATMTPGGGPDEATSARARVRVSRRAAARPTADRRGALCVPRDLGDIAKQVPRQPSSRS